MKQVEENGGGGECIQVDFLLVVLPVCHIRKVETLTPLRWWPGDKQAQKAWINKTHITGRVDTIVSLAIKEMNKGPDSKECKIQIKE